MVFKSIFFKSIILKFLKKKTNVKVTNVKTVEFREISSQSRETELYKNMYTKNAKYYKIRTFSEPTFQHFFQDFCQISQFQIFC